MAILKQNTKRRTDILQVIAALLEAPMQEKITTAVLAKKLDLSEAALYRHFASKAQMFDALIDFIDGSISSLTNRICEAETVGTRQTELILAALLSFAQKNRGLTRILIGEALVHENPRLQKSVQQILDRLAAQLRQTLKLTATQGQFAADIRHINASATLLLSYVLGRWHLFVRSGFVLLPAEGWPEHWRALCQGLFLPPSP